MSNRRSLLVFLIGSLILGGVCWMLSWRTGPVPSVDAAVTFPFGPDEVDSVEIVRAGVGTNRLVCTSAGDWYIEWPFKDRADPIALAKLLDGLLLVRLQDRLTAADRRSLGRELRDFGLATPRVTVTVHAGSRHLDFAFGDETPSGHEVYLRLGVSDCVFVVPRTALDVVSDDVDGLRRRQVFDLLPAQIAAVDVRQPGGYFCKFSREQGGWRMVEPAAVANATAVNDLVSQLLQLKIVRFVWPDVHTTDVEVDLETGTLKASRLAPFGLAEEDEASVTLWTLSGKSERIVIGRKAGENEVHALVHGGTTIATLPAAVATLCQTPREKFVDTRLYPVEGLSLTSISVTADGVGYLLTCVSNGVWQLAAPTMAPADPIVAAKLVEHILQLKQEHCVPEGAETYSVSVSLKDATSASITNFPPVAVSRKGFPPLVDLRSKQILSLDVGTIRRLTVKAGGVNGIGSETVVARDEQSGAWLLEKAETASAVRVGVNLTAVERILKALTAARASSVDNINPSHDDFVRCGLAPAAFTIAVDLASSETVRSSLMLGNAAPGGGRYATAGGVDAIFIVSRELVADLTVPLTETVLEKSIGKTVEKK